MNKRDITALFVLIGIVVFVIAAITLYKFKGHEIAKFFGHRDTIVVTDTIHMSETLKETCKTFTANGVSFDMILVEAGTFTMGATSEIRHAADDEKPAHEVTLTNDFYIGKTEVTQELWQTVMGNNPSRCKGRNKPVELVSWNDCQVFISKLNEITGEKFRMLTEAEWEYAARGGNESQHSQYSGSVKLRDVACYGQDPGSGSSRNVAMKQPNELGIYDMSGNVDVWCEDWYGSYSSESQVNPTGPSSGTQHVHRGGGWFDRAEDCRVSARFHREANLSYDDVGLRLALSKD